MKFHTLRLFIINTVMFFMEIFIPLTAFFVLVPSQVSAAPWTIITSMFLHADLEHLFSNMFALVLFGLVLEKVIGSRKFLIVYFTSGIAASFAGMYFYSNANLLGASGAIMGIIGALAILRPKLIVWIGLPLPMIAVAFVWALIDLVGLFTPAGEIANASHLAGLFVGILFGLYWRKKYGINKKIEKRIKSILSDEELEEWEEGYM